MKIKTQELTGVALDWVVAKCEGYEVGVITREDMLSMQLAEETDPVRIARVKDLFANADAATPAFVFKDGWKSDSNSALAAKTGWGRMEFSTRWSQGGQIIEREKINLAFNGDQWWASYDHPEHVVWERAAACGNTPLIAAMRCYVASKLGDEVDIPEELLK